MKAGRRGRGFEPLGASGARGLSLPARRTRDLALAVAWRRAAGPALAARARAVLMERGVLEVEVPDRRWAEVLADQLRELASLTAVLAPELRIRKLRVRLPDGTELMAAASLAPAPEPAPVPPAPPVARARAGASGKDAIPEEVTAERLTKLRDRYLARCARERRRSGSFNR
jgi:hypothetical protein